jgi:hypothetical protein
MPRQLYMDSLDDPIQQLNATTWSSCASERGRTIRVSALNCGVSCVKQPSEMRRHGPTPAQRRKQHDRHHPL